MPVQSVGTCPPTDCTGIHFTINPASGDYAFYTANGNSWNWDPYQLQWSQPSQSQDPAYFASRVTVQKGHTSGGSNGIVTGTATLTGTGFTSGQVGYDIHISGILTTIVSYVSATVVTFVPQAGISNGASITYEVWNPASDWEGANDPFMGSFYLGRSWKLFSNPLASQQGNGPGSLVTIVGDNPANWTYPSLLNSDGTTNLNRTYRFRVYAISRQGENDGLGAGLS